MKKAILDVGGAAVTSGPPGAYRTGGRGGGVE